MHKKKSKTIIVGIDEVGRGSLAGPVVVAAAMLEGSIRNAKLGRLKDSKQLTKQQREAWCDYLINFKKISFAIARVYPRQIEKRNISCAANLAAERALYRLTRAGGGRSVKVFLDGGLFLGSRKKQNRRATTLIKGDEKIQAVAAASIIAKVLRDRQMVRLAKKFPRYGFEIHKGYGTKMHREAVDRYGPTDAHRLTFLGQKVQ